MSPQVGACTFQTQHRRTWSQYPQIGRSVEGRAREWGPACGARPRRRRYPRSSGAPGQSRATGRGEDKGPARLRTLRSMHTWVKVCTNRSSPRAARALKVGSAEWQVPQSTIPVSARSTTSTSPAVLSVGSSNKASKEGRMLRMSRACRMSVVWRCQGAGEVQIARVGVSSVALLGRPGDGNRFVRRRRCTACRPDRPQ